MIGPPPQTCLVLLTCWFVEEGVGGSLCSVTPPPVSSVRSAAGGHQSSREPAVVGQVPLGHTGVPPERAVCDETSRGRRPAGQTVAGHRVATCLTADLSLINKCHRSIRLALLCLIKDYASYSTTKVRHHLSESHDSCCIT